VTINEPETGTLDSALLLVNVVLSQHNKKLTPGEFLLGSLRLEALDGLVGDCSDEVEVFVDVQNRKSGEFCGGGNE
jgi:hypothetical protein